MPKAAILTPGPTTDECFDPKDIARLAERCEVVDPHWPEKPTPEQLAEAGRGADVWIAGWNTPPLPDAAFDAAPGLRLLAYSAGSTRSLLTPDFWKRGVALTTANGPLAIGVAETSLGFLIASAKRMWEFRDRTRQGRWGRGELVPGMKELFDTTVGVVSASKVGRHFLTLLRPFEVRRLLFDPYVSAKEAESLGAEKAESLADMAPQCDYLVICAPNLPETRAMVSRDILKSLPDDCIVINAARGAVIDEPAMVEELEKGRLFACLDVTHPEPPAPESPLWRLPNVVLTPHIAGCANNARRRLGRAMVDEVLRFLDGQPLNFGVTEEQWRIMA